MRLIELLERDRVIVPLHATVLADAAMDLSETLIATGAIADPEGFRELVPTAIPRDVVAVGQAFLVHYRTELVKSLAAALGVAEEPLKRQEDSDSEARLVVLLVAPPAESSAHLRALSTFARALSRQEVADAILTAREPDEVMKVAPFGDIELPRYLTVRDVMVPRRLSLRPDMTLGEASKLMVAHNVAALPVVSEDDEVLGLVSHKELLNHLLPAYVKRESTGELRASPRRSREVPDPHDIPVREVMDRSVLCVSQEQTLADVAPMMVSRDIERFPVVRDGALVGFLTRADIVRRLFGR
jgi:CBS domain-containing protein